MKKGVFDTDTFDTGEEAYMECVEHEEPEPDNHGLMVIETHSEEMKGQTDDPQRRSSTPSGTALIC